MPASGSRTQRSLAAITCTGAMALAVFVTGRAHAQVATPEAAPVSASASTPAIAQGTTPAPAAPTQTTTTEAPPTAVEATATPTPAKAPASASATAPCAAVAPDEEPDATEGAGIFLAGAGFLDFSELNDRLAANGYERIDSTVALLGGEGRAILESGFVIGGRGVAVLVPTGEGPGAMRRHLAGAFGMADFGFALVHTPAVAFTLTGGIGGYGLDLELSDDRSAAFDDVLVNPRRGASLSTGGFLVGVNLGFDGRVPIGKVEDGRRAFFTLGVRAGGMFGPSIGAWSLDSHADATGGPDGALNGGYVALALGFGGGPAEFD